MKTNSIEDLQLRVEPLVRERLAAQRAAATAAVERAFAIDAAAPRAKPPAVPHKNAVNSDRSSKLSRNHNASERDNQDISSASR